MKKIFDFGKNHALKFFSLILTFSLMLFAIAIPGMNAATPSSEYSAIQKGNAVNCIYVTEDHLCDLMTYMHNQYHDDYEGAMDLITLSNGFKLRAEWSYDDRNEDWPDQLVVYSVFQDGTTGWDNDSAYVIINGYRIANCISCIFFVYE